MRRAVVAALLAGGVLLAACGGAEQTGSTTVAAATVSSDDELLAVTSTVDMTDEEYADYMAELEAASQAEGGQLNYYFSAPATSNEPLFDAFTEQYPWVEIRYTSGGTLELIERVLTESAAGRESADVLQGGPLEDNSLCLGEGLCLDYDPRGEKDIPAERAYDDCSCTVADFFAFVINYNTDLIDESEVPATLEEFASEEWRGRFGFNIDQLDWFAGELAYRGEEEGLELMQAIADNDPVTFSGSEGQELLIAGQFPVMIPGSVTGRVTRAIDDGAPIGIATTPVVIAQPDMYFGLAAAPNPATTRLYLEFLMSEEWQMQAGEGIRKVPILPGAPVHPSIQSVVDEELFFETTENFGDYETRVEQHQSLFILG